MAKKLKPVEAVLQFLRENKIGDGKWCIGVKDQFEKLIELVGEGSDMFTRVWACIYLHTMGYLPTAAGIESHSAKSSTALNQPLLDQCKHVGGVLAVTSYNGKIIPLTTALIAKELNRYAVTAAKKENASLSEEDLLALKIDDEDVRRQVVRMERMGIVLRTDGNDTPLSEIPLAQRLRLNSAKRLGRRTNRADQRTGQTPTDGGSRIYFFLQPRKNPTALKSGGFWTGGALHRKDFRKAPLQLGVEEAQQLCFEFAGRYQLPEEVAVYAGRRDVADKLAQLKQKEEELRDLILKIKAEEEQGRLFPEETRKSPALARQTKPPKTTEELAPIAAELDRWHETWERGKAWVGARLTYDDRFLKQLFGACRDGAPDCTPEEVAWWTSHRLAIKRGQKLSNPYGYLMKVVPECFEGDGFQKWRAGNGEAAEPSVRVTACSDCGGSGLIGLDWNTIPEAVEAVSKGAQYCPCPEGETTRFLVEPALMRTRSAS